MFQHLRNDVKDLARLEKILLVFFEEGLGHYIIKTKLRKHLPFRKRWASSFTTSLTTSLTKPFSAPKSITDKEALALHLRHAFERLGASFVKLGQLLSLRPDLVPPEFCKEFEKLQDQVPPFHFEQVKKIIEEDLQKPLSKLFRNYERKPIASASIAQIHRAVLPSGKIVAVKVQRPDVRKIIDTDLDLLDHLARALERRFPETRPYRPKAIVREFALWTRKELNFEVEARSAQRLKAELSSNKEVKVPQIYPAHSSKRVLTMEFVEGIKIDNLVRLREYRLNREKIALTYFTSILEQALLYGFFHADPHPANIFVQRDGKLVFLDYGIMGELSLADRQKLIRFINSLPEKDAEKSLGFIVSLARDTSHAQLNDFKQEALPLLEEAYSSTIGERSMGSALYQIIALGARYGLVFDPNHVLMAKAVYQAEGLGLKLYPQFKVADGLQLFAQKYLKERYSPSTLAKKAIKSLWSQRELLADLPEHLHRIVEKLEQPEPPQQLEVGQLAELEREWEFLSRKRMLGSLIMLLILGAGIFFYLERRTTVWGIPISLLFFFLGLILLYFFLSAKQPQKNTETTP
ncbi:MAG: AarF/UbiB family protein [Nanoarchaeota archaeon]